MRTESISMPMGTAKSENFFILRFLPLFIVLFFYQFNHPLQAETGEIDDVFYEFNHIDSCYSFRGIFLSQARFDCLIRILYDFEHLKNLIPGANSIMLIQQGKNWYDVGYTFKMFLFTNKSVYRKTLKLEEKKIVFKMISNIQNTNLFPKMLSSSGYYQIKCESTGFTIEYFQECIINSTVLKDMYMHMAKKESKKFILKLKEYIESNCHELGH